MLWLIVAILAYLILSLVFLVDKYLLTGPILNSKVYAFYVGALGGLVLLLAPFIGFYLPERFDLLLSLFTGMVNVLALFWFYKTLQLFEASRVIPTIGGFTPLFTFFLVYFLSSSKEILSLPHSIALVFLVLGGILINFKKEERINLKSLSFSFVTAFLFSLVFVLTKYVYLNQSFWNGFIWKGLGGSLMAVCFFLFFPEVRKEINRKKEKTSQKVAFIFLLNQLAGAGATTLQNWAIFLAPLAAIPLVHALNGVQYLFLFIFSLFLSFKFPFILKEEISWQVVLQKTVALILIITGLAFLSLW